MPHSYMCTYYLYFMLKDIKSNIVYVRSLICTFPLFALFPPKSQERVKVDFYCEILSRKYLFFINDLEAHRLTYTKHFTVIFKICRNGFLFFKRQPIWKLT